MMEIAWLCIGEWICHIFFNVATKATKYQLSATRLLTNIEEWVSRRLAFELKYNITMNPEGGAGINIEMDLHMEHLNREYKGTLILLM